jgi:hypothetical protein
MDTGQVARHALLEPARGTERMTTKQPDEREALARREPVRFSVDGGELVERVSREGLGLESEESREEAVEPDSPLG